MTIVVYRDGIMCADGVSASRGRTFPSGTKLWRAPDGSIAGSAGCTSRCQAFGAWFEKGRNGDFDPKCGPDVQFIALIVSPLGSVTYLEDDGFLRSSDEPWHVIGADVCELVAVGALEMGASAEQAVAAAIKHTNQCGGPIQTERLMATPHEVVGFATYDEQAQHQNWQNWHQHNLAELTVRI